MTELVASVRHPARTASDLSAFGRRRALPEIDRELLTAEDGVGEVLEPVPGRREADLQRAGARRDPQRDPEAARGAHTGADARPADAESRRSVERVRVGRLDIAHTNRPAGELDDRARVRGMITEAHGDSNAGTRDRRQQQTDKRDSDQRDGESPGRPA